MTVVERTEGAGGPPATQGPEVGMPADATQEERAAARKQAKRRTLSRNWSLFLLFAGPNILLILAFIYYPLISNMYYSTLDWRLGSPRATPVGLDNYVRFFTSPSGQEVWRVTAIFTLGAVVGSMILGLLIALVLNKKLPGRTAARTAVFAPYVLSGVGVALVWNFIFDPTRGALSHILGFFGISSPEWYLNENWALVMVIIVYVWKNLGFCAVVFLAGLQGIPQDLLDAARIDGASEMRIWWRIMIPLSKPALITVIIFSFQHTWNDFLAPLIFLTRTESWTLSLGLVAFTAGAGEAVAYWHWLMAAATTMVLPMIVIFLFAQRHFIGSAISSGVKG